MKMAINTKVVLSLCLLGLTGAHALAAAEPSGDAQQQARTLLTGKSFGVSEPATRSAIAPAPDSRSVVLDAQEQGRRMILGQATVRASTGPVIASGLRAKAIPADRKGEEGAHEMARRMILHGAL
jgi:hypothetical protein